MERNLAYWMWLSFVCGPASCVPKLLYRQFGDIGAIYQASAEDYRAAGVSETLITALCDKNLDRVRSVTHVCEQNNIGILTYQNPLYPDRLRRIQDPPAVLYYRGFVPDMERQFTVSVVGTRAMTDDGRKNTYRLAFDLAVCGAVIVSGMALGVDGTAQTAALDAGGRTIAVLGTAIDCCYPREHLPLYERLISEGGIFSEYPPGTQTQAWAFPQRNRIISGISQVVLVTEGNRKSGALITAKNAMLQGRDVYAYPGDPFDKAHEGPNLLLKNGARAATSALDILRPYAELYGSGIDLSRVRDYRYYTQYDDRLRYGKEAIEKRLQADPYDYRLKKPAETASPEPVPRKAPEEQPLREERYTEKAEQFLSGARNEDAASPVKETAPTAQAAPFVPAEPDESAESVKSAVSTEPVDSVPESAAVETELEPSAPTPVPGNCPSLSEGDLQLLSRLKTRKTVDELCAEGLPAGNLLAALTLLELHGYVRSLPGGAYIAIQK